MGCRQQHGAAHLVVLSADAPRPHGTLQGRRRTNGIYLLYLRLPARRGRPVARRVLADDVAASRLAVHVLYQAYRTAGRSAPRRLGRGLRECDDRLYGRESAAGRSEAARIRIAANTPQDNRRRTAVVASRHTALARRRHRRGKHRRGVGQRSESMPLRVGRRYQKAVRRDRHSVPLSPDRRPVDKGRPTVSHRPPVAAFAGAECGSRLRHPARLRVAFAIRQRDRPPSNLGSSVGTIP